MVFFSLNINGISASDNISNTIRSSINSSNNNNSSSSANNNLTKLSSLNYHSFHIPGLCLHSVTNSNAMIILNVIFKEYNNLLNIELIDIFTNKTDRKTENVNINKDNNLIFTKLEEITKIDNMMYIRNKQKILHFDYKSVMTNITATLIIMLYKSFTYNRCNKYHSNNINTNEMLSLSQAIESIALYMDSIDAWGNSLLHVACGVLGRIGQVGRVV